MSQLDDNKTNDYSLERINTVEHNQNGNNIISNNISRVLTPKKKSKYRVRFSSSIEYINIQSYKSYNNMDSFPNEEPDLKKNKCVSCGCILF